MSVAAPPSLVAQRCRVAEVEVTSVTVRVGGREPLVVIFRDAQGIPCQDEVAYSATSSNRVIATVPSGTIRSGGMVTGVAEGNAIITVRAGVGRSAQQGQGVVVVASATVPVDTQGAAPVPAPGPAVIDSAARGTGPGSATLRYQREGSGPAAGLVVDPSIMQLLPGESRALNYRTASASGGPAERAPIVFSVSQGVGLISIDSIGVVTASRDTGEARVRASAFGRPTILPMDISVLVQGDSVRFGRPVVALAPGDQDTVRLRVPAQRRDIEGSLYRYASSDTSMVRVQLFQPIIEAVAVGEATITASSPFLPNVSMTVNVHPPVSALAFSDSSILVAIGQARTLTMRPVTADGSPVAQVPAMFSGLDTTRVSFRYDRATGTATLRGLAAGPATLTMAVHPGRDTANVVRRDLPIRVVAGALRSSVTRTGLGLGERQPVTITVLDGAGQPIADFTAPVTWMSSDSTVARVENGQIVTRGLGRARLTARAPVGWDSTVSMDVFGVGDLLLVKKRAGLDDVYSYSRAAAGQWQQITRDSAVEWYAAWGPALSHIAYVSAGSLIIADADGANPRVVFPRDSGSVRSPSFIREGQAIVFEVQRDSRFQIYTVNVDGTGVAALPLGDANTQGPSVSPDNRRIAYSSVRGDRRERTVDVYLAGLDGSNEIRLTQSPAQETSPQYAADGRSVYYLRREGGSRPTSRVYRQGLTAGDTAVALSPPDMYVNAYSVSGDGSLLSLTVLDAQNQSTLPRLVLFTPATGAQIEVTLGAGEMLGGTGAALRPSRPAAPRP